MKYLLYKHDWDDEKRIYKLLGYWVRTDEPVAYVPSIKGKDQNAVVRLKNFQKLVDSILKHKLKGLTLPTGENSTLRNNKSTMWEKLQLAREGLTL